MSLDASIQEFAMDDPGDASLMVKFEMRVIEDKQKTREEGRYIGKEAVWIEARPMGKIHPLFSRKATPRDLERFKDRYNRWLSDQDEPLEGTPIDEWPAIPAVQREEFKHRGIRTVEDILLVNDSVAQDFMGFYQIKRLAQAFVETGASKKAAEAIIARDEQIADLSQKVEELMARLEEMESAKPAVTDEVEKPRRKRRTKAEMAESQAQVPDTVLEV